MSGKFSFEGFESGIKQQGPMLTGEIDRSSTGGVNPVRGCLINPSRLD
jgi:hypothetical protein